MLNHHPLGAAYPVALPAFQGPLDLLLQLIERQELDISEISLVAVTDQYVQTIEQMQNLEPGAIADFLVIASKLLYIKSRALLPKPRPPEEEGEEESSDALIRQLLEYRYFKEVAASLQEREALGLRTFLRQAPLPHMEKYLDASNLDATQLYTILRKVLQRIPTPPPMPRVKTYPVTVAEQIEIVRRHLQRLSITTQRASVNFRELLSQQRSRLEIIVTFLAVLELIKQSELMASQESTFGEIWLSPASRNDP
jgi:segregation and condensation protein A